MKKLFQWGLLVVSHVVFGQEITRVDPPYWWKMHPVDTLELVVQGEKLTADFTLPKRAGEVLEQKIYKKGRYAHLKIALNLGEDTDQFRLACGRASYTFELRDRGAHRPLGLDPSDLVYLITPDRFSNGDPEGDRVSGMREQGVDRTAPYARHGGDLKGVGQRLDYLQSLGVGAVWLNPVLENDMARDSYHGYAITDHYAVDARYGGNEGLEKLARALHERGMKHVADVVYNHWGAEHYLQRDLPDSALVHWNADGSIPYSNFRFASMTDPHREAADSMAFQDGWFASAMPDLNQDHPLMRAYLTYATLWYVEAFDVDALRCDTYAFSSPDFLRELNRTLKRAYPDLFVFGETWAYSEASQAYFAPNHLDHVRGTGLDAVTDFTYWRALHEMYSAEGSEQFGWNTGAGALYYRLANDLLYSRPGELVVFLDNHDEGRFLGQFHGDRRKLRSALTLLYFSRGIPVLLYGTELGLQGHENHGAIREDMPFFDEEFPDYSKIGGDLLSLCQELGRLRQAYGPIQSLQQRVPREGWLQWRLAMQGGRELLLVLNATELERAGPEPDGLERAEVVWSSERKLTTDLYSPWEVRIYESEY